MKEFELKEANFIGDIKHQVSNFINDSKVLSADQKRDLQKELGTNWHDERFCDTVKEVFEMDSEEINTPCQSTGSYLVDGKKIAESLNKIHDEVMGEMDERFEKSKKFNEGDKF